MTGLLLKKIDAKGLLATCLQHEIDHINGVGDHEWLRRRGDIGFFHIRGAHVCDTECTGNPSIAKGKPCNTCHAGSPPSKANLKKVTLRPSFAYG